MINALLDTTVVIHLLRRYAPALAWFNNPQVYGVSAVTWIEVMQGATSKAKQAQAKHILAQFELLCLPADDQQRAMEQLERFQFSHHISMSDYPIAAAARRLELPLRTHNLRDMTPLLGALAVKPY